MKKEYNIILLGFLFILILDLVGSITSVKFNYSYSNLLPLSLLIYIVIPILATRQKGLKFGILSGTLLGLFDSTIGWKISMSLGANSGVTQDQVSNGIWIFVIIVVTFCSTLLALFISWLTTLFMKNK